MSDESKKNKFETSAWVLDTVALPLVSGMAPPLVATQHVAFHTINTTTILLHYYGSKSSGILYFSN